LNIDPQERLFLQCAWLAIADAGYKRTELQRFKVGVFAGVTKTGFENYRTDNGLQKGFNPRTSFSSIANRVSHFFDFKGPSLAIDTMCSSSLVAIHEACRQIKDGSCDMALVGGVNLYLHLQIMCIYVKCACCQTITSIAVSAWEKRFCARRGRGVIVLNAYLKLKKMAIGYTVLFMVAQ